MMRVLSLALLFHLSAFAQEDRREVVDDRGQAPEARAAKGIPSLWLVGDSTVKGSRELRGWGQEIDEFFDSGEIQVVNRAIGGRSSRTYHAEGRWQAVLDELAEGDFVIIQFGHNDVGPIDGRSKFRGSLKGLGDEAEEVEKPDGSVETVRTYGWYLREYARTAKAKGAVVVLCSPVPHKDFDRNGDFIPDWSEWRGWVRSCAKAEDVHFVDLAELIGEKYAELGEEGVEPLFADKRTHTSAAGAKLNAEIVVSALKELPGDPLRDCFAKP